MTAELTQAEQFGTLASNWREAEATGDRAASKAFEDELHARVTIEDIRTLVGTGPSTGEPSSAATARLRAELEEMWNNASARLD